MTTARLDAVAFFRSNFQTKITITDGKNSWDYSIRPLRLKDDVDLTESLVHFFKDQPFETLALTVSELVWRRLERDPLGCYLVHDANEHLIGHLTFDLAKKGPFIFVSSNLERHFWPLTMCLWNWVKICLKVMVLMHVKVQKKIPIQEALLCMRISSEDVLKRKILESEGFLEDDQPFKEPPNNTLYQMNLSGVKDPVFYRLHVEDATLSPTDPCQTFLAWNELSQPYLPN